VAQLAPPGRAQLADGLVALPLDARNRERLEWVAEDAVAAGGTATVWLATPTSRRQERAMIDTLSDARAAEYREIAAEAPLATTDSMSVRRRVLRRLRRRLREIRRRDYFPPAEREEARAAVNALAHTLADEAVATAEAS
jgi:uncharacterized protein YdbL (DUF1318 family)